MPSNVAITGLGIVSALGIGCKANLDKMNAGVSGVGPVTLFDSKGLHGGEVKNFPCPGVFSKRELKRLSRSSLLLLTAVRESIKEAGLSPCSEENPMKRAVVLGTTLGGMTSGTTYYQEFLTKGHRKASAHLSTDYLPQSQLHHVVKELYSDGPAFIVSDACASGTVAIGMGARMIKEGEADTVLVGGYDPLSWYAISGFYSLGVYTSSLCRPFDKDRNGMVLGEGAGVLVLENYEKARKRNANIRGWVLGYGESTDSFHLTRPHPQGEGAVKAIREALIDANISEENVEYINAHGTGTRLNDASEAIAICKSLGKRAPFIPISSVKPMVGHVLGGAGAIEAILTLLAMHAGVLPPNLGLENKDESAGTLDIIREPRQTSAKIALSFSFGFGGQNAVVALESV